MEVSSSKWISEIGIEDSTLFHQYQVDPLDYFLDGFNFQTFSSEGCPRISPKNKASSYVEASNAGVERPPKQLKTNSWNSCPTEHITPKASPSSSQIISFENSTSSPAISQQVYGLEYAMNPKKEAGCHGNLNSSSLVSQGSFVDKFCLTNYVQKPKRASSITRSTPSHSQDHVIAERKRREKLNQRFISLSALVPRLKKMDRASILEESIKYLKQLEERVKMLEEQAAKKTVESMIFRKKSKISADDEISSSDENFDCQPNQYFPEIEVRVFNADVLIRIHCVKNNSSIANILSEIEKLHLTIVSGNILPVGNSTLDITVVAQIGTEVEIAVKDLVKNLQLTLRKFM